MFHQITNKIKSEIMATLTISNQQVEIKKIADYMSQMDSGVNDDGKYENLILASDEKKRWIEQNFRIVRGNLDVNLAAAFNVIEK